MINPFDKYKQKHLDPPVSQQEQYYRDLRFATREYLAAKQSNPNLGIGHGYFSEIPTTTRNINYARNHIKSALGLLPVDLRLGVIDQVKYNQQLHIYNTMLQMLDNRVNFLKSEGLL